MMSGYQLRRHLAQHHDVRCSGLDYAALTAIHDIEHRVDQDHTHDDDVGQGQLQGFLWTLALLLAILLMLKVLGVHL